MEKRKVQEAMKVTAQHVSDIGSLKLEDPRQSEDCKIYYERKGVFVSDEKVYKGSYLVYNAPSMKKSFAGVFVAEDLDEDAGINPVTLVALDPVRNRVVGRTSYRARVSQKAFESEFRRGK